MKNASSFWWENYKNEGRTCWKCLVSEKNTIFWKTIKKVLIRKKNIRINFFLNNILPSFLTQFPTSFPSQNCWKRDGKLSEERRYPKKSINSRNNIYGLFCFVPLPLPLLYHSRYSLDYSPAVFAPFWPIISTVVPEIVTFTVTINFRQIFLENIL